MLLQLYVQEPLSKIWSEGNGLKQQHNYHIVNTTHCVKVPIWLNISLLCYRDVEVREIAITTGINKKKLVKVLHEQVSVTVWKS